MIGFIKNNAKSGLELLREGEAFMFSTKVDPSPLIKIRLEDATPERWGSWTDKQFFDKYCHPDESILLEDDKP